MDDKMNKCPYCGAELQENAAFCLYCMRSLNDKKDVSPAAKPRRGKAAVLIAVAVCAVLAVALTVVWISLRGETAGEDRERSSASDAPETSASTEPSESGEPDNVWPNITTFEDFTLRIVQSKAGLNPTYLWDSDGFKKVDSIVDGDGDDWEVYTTEVYKDGVTVKTYFCEGGLEIITTVNGLTDETYYNGLQLADCLAASVYDDDIGYVSEMLDDNVRFPYTQVSAEESWMRHVGFDTLEEEGLKPSADTVIRQKGIGFEGGTYLDKQILGLETRVRTYKGEKLYDIIIWHTQNR